MDNDNSKLLEEIVDRISAKSFSKYAFKENQIISNGVSIFDVAQEKIKEFLQRNRKPQADPEEDSRWIDRNINQGIRKLYKKLNAFDSIDDDDFNQKNLALDSKIQTKLEKYQIIQRVFKTYTRRNQLILELSLFAGLDNKTVAEKSGTTEGNVRKIVCEFKKDCRRYGLEPTADKQGEKNRGEKK